MASITINVKQIDDIKCGWRQSDDKLSVTLDMTKTQMKEALGQFLENSTAADLEDWIEELCPEFRKEEQS